MLKISIVTPSYNSAKFIEDCIQSVLNQNYPNFEHIIVDGGSTDGTIEILKKYPHLIWISEPDEGQSDAINKGFKIVTGDIIGWLNSDDIYLPNTFNLVSKSLSDSKIDAIYSNYMFIDSVGNITREIITQKSSKWMSLFYCYIPSTTFFFKRKIIDKSIFIDKEFNITMDKEFFAHLFYLHYNIKKCDGFFAQFRWHDDNKSIDTNEVKIARLKEGIKILNRYSYLKLPINEFGIIIYWCLNKFVSLYRLFARIFGVGVYG